MRILVVYATKYGATKGIAERIAQSLNDAGQQAAIVSAAKPGPLDGYDAFVIGSAVYMFSWMKDASDFVRKNAALLKTKPVWLFCSGPISTDTEDEKGRDIRETARPKEFAEFKDLIAPRDEHVFWGVFDHTKLSVGHRLVYNMPAMKKLMIDGDYRNWYEIDAWARSIAAALVPAGVS